MRRQKVTAKVSCELVQRPGFSSGPNLAGAASGNRGIGGWEFHRGAVVTLGRLPCSARAATRKVTDAGGNPVSGVSVKFTAPGSGASGTFAGGSTTASVTLEQRNRGSSNVYRQQQSGKLCGDGDG